MFCGKIKFNCDEINMNKFFSLVTQYSEIIYDSQQECIYFRIYNDDIDLNKLKKDINKCSFEKNNFIIKIFKNINELEGITDQYTKSWFIMFFQQIEENIIAKKKQRELKELKNRLDTIQNLIDIYKDKNEN